jgi:hypothetical protein
MHSSRYLWSAARIAALVTPMATSSTQPQNLRMRSRLYRLASHPAADGGGLLERVSATRAVGGGAALCAVRYGPGKGAHLATRTPRARCPVSPGRIPPAAGREGSAGGGVRRRGGRAWRELRHAWMAWTSRGRCSGWLRASHWWRQLAAGHLTVFPALVEPSSTEM